MKNLNSVLASILIVCSSVLQAQTASTAAHRTNTQIIDFILSLQEESVVAVAEAMPAEKYSFAPTNGGFARVRTFAEQRKHIAADNYLLGAGILGEKPPADVGNWRAGIMHCPD